MKRPYGYWMISDIITKIIHVTYRLWVLFLDLRLNSTSNSLHRERIRFWYSGRPEICIKDKQSSSGTMGMRKGSKAPIPSMSSQLVVSTLIDWSEESTNILRVSELADRCVVPPLSKAYSEGGETSEHVQLLHSKPVCQGDKTSEHVQLLHSKPVCQGD